MNQHGGTQEHLNPDSPSGAVEALLLLLILGAGVLLLHVPKESATLHFDCSAYAAQSVNIARGEGNTMRWGGENIPGFYPPGYPALTAPFHWILGYHMQNGVTANFVMGLLTLLGVYLLGRRLAGPLAGAASALVLLGCPVFPHVAHNIFSQMPSLLFLVLSALLLLAGWREGPRAWLLRFAAGLLCGLSVFIRYNNVALSPALAVFVLVMPPPGGSRWRAAFPAWLGIALAAGAVMAYNAAKFGLPWLTGYESWGFQTEKTFSLSYLFHPFRIQMDPGDYQLVRSLLGFGMLYAWPVALLALLGMAQAWIQRRRNPDLLRAAVLTLLTTSFLYAFLALYFFRSPIYTMLTLPLIAVMAGTGLAALLRRIRIRGMSLGWLSVVLALAYLLPSFVQYGIFSGEEAKSFSKGMTTFEAADRYLEDDAILMGGANPILAEYLFARDTGRRYLFMTTQPGAHYRRRVARELGSEPFTVEALDRYVRDRLAEGRPVYFMHLYPAQPGDREIMVKVFYHLKQNFELAKTDIWTVYRVREKGGT